MVVEARPNIRPGLGLLKQELVMHIAEGALSAPVLVGGAVLAAAGVAEGLKKMDLEQIPRVAVLSSAFFVASLIHVPIGPSSAHLILNGLAGLILGWAVFPALLIALFLQAVFFGFGGLTVLGVNTLVMALPGLVCGLIFRRPIQQTGPRWSFAAGFGAGVLGVLLGCLILALSLFASARQFLPVIKLVVAAHLPVMIIEGLITGAAVVFLKKVKPELLGEPSGPVVDESSAPAPAARAGASNPTLTDYNE